MIYTIVKTKENVIYAAVEGDIDFDIVKVEADNLDAAFIKVDPEFIKRKEEELLRLKKINKE